jgi:hypothetical protein
MKFLESCAKKITCFVLLLQAVQEFVLGEYDAEATAAFNQNISEISTLEDPRSKDASQRYDFIKTEDGLG